MPLCTIHLFSLAPPTTIPSFLHSLSSSLPPVKPLVTSLVIRWIILPTTLSTPSLLAHNIHWDLLLILPASTPLPSSIRPLIAHTWTVTAGVPSRLLQDFHSKNHGFLHPITNPSLTPEGKEGERSSTKIAAELVRARIESQLPRTESSQDLSLSGELWDWIQTFGTTKEGQSPLSMLNLLSFKPGKKADYLKYGEEFARGAGRKRGGNAKIVGSVVHDSDKTEKGGEAKGTDDGEGWDEVALAQYPSIWHFADMLASEDYQSVNQKYRVGSLRDTFILCTSEIALEELVGKEGKLGPGSKL